MLTISNPDAFDALLSGAWDSTRREDTLIHVSDLLHLDRGWARLKGHLWTPSKSVQLRVLAGEGGHRVLRSNGTRSFDVEVSLDDIWGHVDLVEEEFSRDIPGEIKFTWRSSRKPITSSGTYFDQLGAYCKMLGVNSGRLYVVYLNGNYKYGSDENGDPQSPTGECWDVTFDPSSLDDWWVELLRRKSSLQDALLQDECPFSTDFEWDGWLLNWAAKSEIAL